MLRNRQKLLLHIYARAARLDDPSYRNVLREFAGVSSARDPNFSQSAFERCMASLERTLFDRVADGMVPDPRPCPLTFSDGYWASKIPDQGKITTRQAFRISQLWAALASRLPPEKREPSYLLGIAAHAVRGSVPSLDSLSSWAADRLIDALKDRIRSAGHDPKIVAENSVPF